MNTELAVAGGVAERVPFDPDLTRDDVARIVEMRRDYEMRRSDEITARRRAQAEMVEAARQRMAEIFGADVAFQIQQFKRALRHRDAVRQLTDGRVDAAEAAAARAKELADYVMTHGVDRTQFDLFTTDLRDIFKTSPLPDFGGKATVVVPPIRALGRSKVSHFRPPFWGEQWGDGAGLVSGFRVNINHLIDSVAGKVGHVITLDDDAATDLDAGSMEGDTQVAFTYRVPRTGLIEVTINAVCGKANHHLSVFDEWGVSWSKVTQTASFMSHVIHPNVGAPSYSFLSVLKHDKDTSTNRDENPYLPGQHVQSSPMVSDGPVPAGTKVEIRAGLHSVDGSLTNDMEVHSRSTQSWFIYDIAVQVLP